MVGRALAPASVVIGRTGGKSAGSGRGAAIGAGGVLATQPMHMWLAPWPSSASGW